MVLLAGHQLQRNVATTFVLCVRAMWRPRIQFRTFSVLLEVRDPAGIQVSAAAGDSAVWHVGNGEKYFNVCVEGRYWL
jgi:hypothetical protein